MNVLNEQYAYRYLFIMLPVYRKWLTLFDGQLSIDCNDCDILWGEDCECQFFWEAICLLRVRSKQWGCNRDDWFSAAVSGRPAISQNENQYIVPFVIIGAPGKKKKALRNDPLMFWLFEPMFHPLMSWGDALHFQKVLKHVSVQKLPSSRYCYKLIYTNSLDAPSRW